MNKIRLILVRHGLTVANLAVQYAGWTDSPLAPEGVEDLKNRREQARQNLPAHLLIASPLTRCRQTAEIYFPEFKPLFMEELKERFFGPFEGKTYEEMKHCPDFITWKESEGKYPAPGVESAEAFTARIHRARQRILELAQKVTESVDWDESREPVTFLVVCHGGPIDEWVSQEPETFQKIYNPEGRPYTMRNGERLILDYDLREGSPVLVRLERDY